MSARSGMHDVSTLVCVKCGFPMYVPRPRCRRRQRGHVKTMWCPRCKAETDHEEEY